MMKHLKYILVTCIGLFVYYYTTLLPINLTSASFLFHLFILAIILIALHQNVKTLKTPKQALKPFYGILIAVLVVILINTYNSPLVQANKYATWTTINEGNFEEDVQQADLANLTLIDKESSMRLGDRVLGDIPEYVSQFSVSNAYTTVTIKGHLYRVTPLEYNSLVKYLANKNEGTPGFILVDSTTGDAKLIRVDGGLHYLDSSYFQKDLRRHIVMHYPTKILANSHFEVDEDLNPYFVTPILKYNGISIRPDVTGVILTNATTGSQQEYTLENIPEWVDHVYPSDLMVNMLNANLTYQGGYLNSIIGQKNVRQLTPAFTIETDTKDIHYAGYQYLPCGNDVCMYSGVTSTTSDESNLGFVISNLRTKETNYYPCSGAEEYSAMASAKGLVQEKNYDATFPLLLNLYGRPTYLVTLKDQAGLVKMYAFVDPQDYQKVYAGDASDGIEAACKKYLAMINANTTSNLSTIQGQIKDLRTITIDGNTYYYFKLDNTPNNYRIQASKQPFLNIEDNIEIEVNEQNEVNNLTIR